MTERSKTTVNLTGTVVVQSHHATVFRYISDLKLDKNWRKEINETTIRPGPQLNAIATEDAYLSKRVPRHRATLQCTEYIPGQKIVYQSLPENPYQLKTTRQAEALSPGSTRIVYQIEFDVAVVKYGLGFQLPVFLIRYCTKTTMNKYLYTLKQLLENQHSPG